MQPLDHTAEPPDRDHFAALILEGIRQAGEKGPLQYDSTTFTIRAEGQGHNQASLGNVYNEYRISDPDARVRLVRNFVRSWFAPLKGVPEDFEDVQPDLLPAVRSRGYIEINSLRLRTDGARDVDWPYRTIGEHLSLSLVYDLPESITSIQQRHLDDWKVNFDHALARALDNLAAISRHRLDVVGPGVWQSPWRDNLDTSRLLLPNLIRAHPVGGDPVIMVPNRDTLLLAGSDDARGLARLAELAEEAWEHPRAVSGIAIRLDGDEWRPFLPPENHPAYARLHRLRLMALAGDYNTQKKALQAWYEKQDEDVYVAPCAVATDKESGESFSYCVWTETIDASLPVAERVYFVRLEDEEPRVLGGASWEQVQELFGARMTAQDLYPPRYRVGDFPEEERLAALLAEEE